MTASAAGSGKILADIGNTGGAGTLVVLILIMAAVGIFAALIGSLRRLRRHVEDGSFAAKAGSEDPDAPTDPSAPRR